MERAITARQDRGEICKIIRILGQTAEYGNIYNAILESQHRVNQEAYLDVRDEMEKVFNVYVGLLRLSIYKIERFRETTRVRYMDIEKALVKLRRELSRYSF